AMTAPVAVAKLRRSRAVPWQAASQEAWRTMPEIYVHAIEGRSIEQKRALVRDITDAVVRHFNVKPEAVMVQIMESPKDLKAKGGFLFSDRPPGLALGQNARGANPGGGDWDRGPVGASVVASGRATAPAGAHSLLNVSRQNGASPCRCGLSRPGPRP